MILTKAREYAEAFAHQQVTECVITVPAFFNQAERRSMLKAAELAGLKGIHIYFSSVVKCCSINESFSWPLQCCS